jgi:undecaprenyl phosphate N,N'-diacetylbacillosamine 1-phosphate transferase
MYNLYFKRLLDLSLSLLLLLLSSPVFVLLAAILWFDTRGNPFFTQIRPGKNERLFKLLKFKSMNDQKDEQGNLLPDQSRLSRFGRFIRKTSLDEIPQLINVLKGDMSLIGPRPLLQQYLPYYRKEERIRHLVRPGISGWAQVNGRNSLGWDKRLALDVYYVDHLSFNLDCLIFYKTIQNVFIAKDVIIDDNYDFCDLDKERRMEQITAVN